MEKYWHWICHELPTERKMIRKMLQKYQSPDQIFHLEEKRLLSDFPEHGKEVKYILMKRKDWNPEEEYQKQNQGEIQFISYAHPGFPKKLLHIPDAPLGLFVKGEIPEQNHPSVAIVGARMCSSYGQALAEQYGRELAEREIQIISGMAMGIDGFAHRGALAGGGRTFAVLGCGTDICYPRRNHDIYSQIPQHGGLISESPPGTQPLHFLFPMRNRIISGLADIVLVIEAKEKSGSLITADLALEQGKEVYAVPGRVSDELSRGCNSLLKQGAGVAISPQNMMEELNLLPKAQKPQKPENKILLESSEKLVYSCLSLQAQNLEQIRKQCRLPLVEVMQALVTLELKGVVREVQKNYYIQVK